MKRFFAVALLVFGVVQGTSAQQPVAGTNSLRADFWDTDGMVHALATQAGVVYVGGDFSYVAPRGRKAAAVNAYTAERLREFPSIVGTAVHVMISDQQGGWYVGGEFTTVGGLSRTNLARIRNDFTVDPAFQPDPNGAVHALILEGARLYLGGKFTRVQGQLRERLAALDLSNAAQVVVTPWSPGANQIVRTMLLSGEVVYVGGTFTRAGGAGRTRLAALATGDNAALPWQPSLDGEVVALGLLEDRLVAGGNFNVADGLSRHGLAAFDRVSGQVDVSWDPNPRDGAGAGGKVTAIRVVCDTVYVGGFFTTIGGADRVRVAAVDGFTGAALSWNPGLGLFRAGTRASSVRTIEVSGDRVFIGGEFNRASGVVRRDLIAADAATGKLLAWNPEFDGGIGAVAVEGATLVAAFLTGPGGVERHNVAAFDEATGRPLADWHPDANGVVHALALAGPALYLAGEFTEVAGLARARLAAVDVATGTLQANWRADANAAVLALAAGPDRLYAGGQFSEVNGAGRRGVAAVDLITGDPLAAWTPRVEFGSVQALALEGTNLYLGGTFQQISGVPRNRLAAIDADSLGALRTWNPAADGPVKALAVENGIVYAGGKFMRVGGLDRAGLAAISAAAGSDLGTVTSWNPGRQTFDLEPDIRALAISGPWIYIGGAFLELGEETRLGLGVVNLAGEVQGWNPGTSLANAVNAVAISSEAVYVGGGVGTATPLAFQSAPSPRILGAFPRVGAPGLVAGPVDLQAFVGDSATFSVTVASDTPVSYQWHFNGVAIPGQTTASLILTNVQVTNSGAYEVRMANAFGRLTAEGALLVLAPIEVLAWPLAATVAPGTNVTLSVEATGSPSPVYHWRLNGILIPGAVYPTLTLTNVNARDGGSYSVIVANRLGAVISPEVAVRVLTNAGPFTDRFVDRGLIAGLSGAVRGSNLGATREDAGGEPRHASKRGGASVWLKWVAPASGRVSFSTRGSGMDTLLGIYTNTALAALGAVVSDEDRGGFLTSRATFDAQAGAEYQIAIDSVGGVAGDLVLSWETEVGAPEAPVLLAQPRGVVTATGGAARFVVETNGLEPLQFQWYRGCQKIRGATHRELVLDSVDSQDVGFYHVRVINEAGVMTESLSAALELGAFPSVRSLEKLEDLLELGGGGGGEEEIGLAPAALVSPAFQLSLGLPVSQTFATSTNGPGLTFSECGALSGSAVLFSFAAVQNGPVQIDTLGSSFDTVLAVFAGRFFFQLTETNRVACDNDGADDRVRSRVTFAAGAGTHYLVRVSGVGGARGVARANWLLGAPPVVVRSNETPRLMAGASGVLDSGVVVSNAMASTYLWLHDGRVLTGATNASLSWTAVDSSVAGVYSVIVSNFAGVVTNHRATVEVRLPPRLADVQWAASAFVFTVTGGPGELFEVHAAADLAETSGWSLVWAGTIPASGRTQPRLDPGIAGSPRRFYRVIPRP